MQGGIYNVSVRKIASLLNSSTAPVYTSFTNIEEIKNMLLDKALSLLSTYTEKTYTHDTFLNIGVGLLIFARENNILYRTLFLENNHFRNIQVAFSEVNLKQMKKERSLSLFSDSELSAILDKMTIYTHGLAALLCGGMLENTDDAWFISKLEEMGEVVIGDMAYKKANAILKCEERRCDHEAHNAIKRD